MVSQQRSQCSLLCQAHYWHQFSQNGTNINLEIQGKTGGKGDRRVRQAPVRTGVSKLVCTVCFSEVLQLWSWLWSPSSTDAEREKSRVTDATILCVSSRRPDPKHREPRRSLLLLTWLCAGSDPGTAWANSLCYWHKVQKGSCVCIK